MYTLPLCEEFSEVILVQIPQYGPMVPTFLILCAQSLQFAGAILMVCKLSVAFRRAIPQRGG